MQESYQRTIRYNSASNALRLEFPPSWNAASISGVTVAIDDLSGAAMLAATAATVYTATTLNANATAGATTITVAGTAGNLSRGDRIRLANPDEDVVVESYNSTSKVATLKRPLLAAHASGVAVYGLWATYTLSTTTTATFPLGKECVLIWTPAGTGDLPLTETAIISSAGLAVQEYRERFAALYPVEYEIAELRLDSVYAEAKERLRFRLSARGMDIDRVVNQAIVYPALLDYMRWLIVIAGGDAFASEREVAWQAFLASEESLTAQPVWVDDNQDQVQTEDEVDTHEPWRRARGL